MSDTHSIKTGGAGPWVFGACMAILGLLGLVMASATHDDGMYAIGLIVFLISAISIFFLIARFVGRHHRGDEA